MFKLMKIFLLIAVLSFVLILVGCAGQESDAPTPTLPEPPQEVEEPAEEIPPEIPEEVPEEVPETATPAYTIVDTHQAYCYDDTVSIPCPEAGTAYFGQDAQYQGNQPDYTDNGDGTITDLNTGLMWAQDPGSKLTYKQAVDGAASFNLAGFDDWLLPTIQELYSLVLFSGYDPSGCESQDDCPDLVPFIDTDFFVFQYGQPEAGERLIDAQFISSTPYVGDGADGGLVFGVNFADGRIKGYGTGAMAGATEEKTFYVLYVRGDTGYGINQFVDNGDGTISDQATGLTWMQTDSLSPLGWQDALMYCEDLSWVGAEDWRLPNAKELHSIVDYTRAPDTSNTAAIHSLFQSTPLTNEAGQPDYGYYWTSTTHLNNQAGGAAAVYLAFGRALGYIDGTWTDIHGAGAQRSDPKSGDPASYPQGFGPQGDAIRVYNLARCVRGGVDEVIFTGGEVDPNATTSSGFGSESGVQLTATVQPGEDEIPPEALEACEGKTANTACEYQGVFGLREGVCNEIFGQLVCMPGVVLPTLPLP